jgi:ATP-binding cassette subfamily C protein LapB
MTLGGMIAASQLAGRAISPFGQLMGLMMQYHDAKNSLTSLESHMTAPQERPANAPFVERPELKGGVELKQLDFAYPNEKQPTLKGLNIQIQPGERIGIIGRMGSGKTTLNKLILGLYTPTEGAVLLDGIDTRQIDPIDIRDAVAHIPQDVLLFYGSLKDNLALGRPHVDDAAILAAAELAGLTEYVNRHPRGFDMQIGERGEGLSGGQKQAVAIARALIGNPAIVLLDEPTSGMDHQSEDQFKARLKEWLGTRTMLLVTHRTSLLELVDRLIVIDNGRVVADGSKAQVVEALQQGRINRAQ